ncbi:MAG: hypothetical protein PVJ49_03435 [Acidobacteriota bacterium]|jgi:hypothetical protein
MKSVDELLENNLLDDAAARHFTESRARVSQRHGNWRASFPAIGALLDSDEERAQALAGNYATEAREIVGVWLSAQQEHAPAPTPLEARIAWVEDFWRAWRARVFAGNDFGALQDGPRERFRRVFDELSARFREDAAGWLRDGGGSGEPEISLVQRCTAPLRAAARAVEGFFFPSVRR